MNTNPVQTPALPPIPHRAYANAGGRNEYRMDAGAHHRAIDVGQRLALAGLWDRSVDLIVVDAYTVHDAIALERIALSDLELTVKGGQLWVTLPATPKPEPEDNDLNTPYPISELAFIAGQIAAIEETALCPWCERGQVLSSGIDDKWGTRNEWWECSKCGFCEDALKPVPNPTPWETLWFNVDAWERAGRPNFENAKVLHYPSPVLAEGDVAGDQPTPHIEVYRLVANEADFIEEDYLDREGAWRSGKWIVSGDVAGNQQIPSTEVSGLGAGDNA